MSYQVPQRGEEKAIPQDGAGRGAEKVERKQCQGLMLCSRYRASNMVIKFKTLSI
jgi:hypothetical protein